MPTRRLNDAELRDADLVVENPLLVEGLTHDPPAPDIVPTIIAEYHLPKEGAVRCCYCEQRQHHQHGFIAEFAPGCRHLIGSLCGTAKLDLQFQAARSSHKDLRSRQNYLRRLDDVAGRVDTVIAECDAVLASAALREVELAAAVLDKRAGNLMLRLRAVGGSLYEDVRVRDLEAETKEDEKRGNRRFKNERRLIGTLRGRGVLNADGFRLRIKGLKDALRNAASLQRSNTDDLPTSKLKKVLNALNDAHEDANMVIEEISRASAFFSANNLALLAQWSASNASARIEIEGSNVLVNGFEIPKVGNTQLSAIAAIK